MAWYAYCIAEKQAFPELDHHRKPIPLDAQIGVLGNQIFLYPASDFAVVVSEHTPEDKLDQKCAVDHARVIADCFQHSTVLPFRFGTIFPDDDSLRRSVRSNQRQFNANVERLRGKAEMHLKVVFEDGGPDSPRYLSSPCVGKEYLSRLRETATVQRERQTKAKAVFVQVHRMFAPLEEDISCRRTDSMAACCAIKIDIPAPARPCATARSCFPVPGRRITLSTERTALLRRSAVTHSAFALFLPDKKNPRGPTATRVFSWASL
jgi:hypothetical protein